MVPIRLNRRTLLLVWLPLIALSYFGSLTVAAHFNPQTYNWRRKAISQLLYPGFDPAFHYLASLGVTFAGTLMVPFAGYIRRRLRTAHTALVDVGTFALAVGAVGLILAGLIVSHPAHGMSAFPRMHEMLARMAAVALGAGMIALWACAAREYMASSASREWRWLTVSWSLVTLPAVLVALLRAAAGAHFNWSSPMYRELENRALWNLGFWEWLGSAAVFLFLLSAALFLPDPDSEIGCQPEPGSGAGEGDLNDQQPGMAHLCNRPPLGGAGAGRSQSQPNPPTSSGARVMLSRADDAHSRQ